MTGPPYRHWRCPLVNMHAPGPCPHCNALREDDE